MYGGLEEEVSAVSNSTGASLTAPLSNLFKIQEQRDVKSPQQRK